MFNSHTKLYGVLGYPVKHSLSPAFHNAAFLHCQINAAYLAFEINPDNLEQAVLGIRSLGVDGCNVTVPHKTAILPFLDELTPAVKAIGASNTIYWNGKNLVGHNTDGIGFMRSLEELHCKSDRKKILIIGAGGAARAIIYALAESGVAQLDIMNRTYQKAFELAQEFSVLFPSQKIESKTIEQLRKHSFDLVVNTTTVGMDHVSSPVDLLQFGNVGALADIIYTPKVTPFMQQAKDLKIPTINGLGMLLYQGVEAFEIWTGHKAPIDVMKHALLQKFDSK